MKLLMALGGLGFAGAIVLGTGAMAFMVPQSTPLLANTMSAEAQRDIPGLWLTILFGAESQCPGLPWSVLAGIGKVESDFGRSTAPGVSSGANSAGAEGPMQFLPATWTAFGAGGNVYSAADAVPAAARYLCSNGGGAPATLRNAILHYNHSDAYVAAVLAWADHYSPVVAQTAPGSAHQVDQTPLFPDTPPGGWPDRFVWGNCTWWVAFNLSVTWGGNAVDWIANAAAQGRTITTLPVAGEIVVYRAGPGYDPDFGHVAIVIAGGPDSYTVSEMNYLGLDVVDTRTIGWPDGHVLGFIAR